MPEGRCRLALVVLLLLFPSSFAAADEDVAVHAGSYRFTYERVDLPGAERIGLAGAGYRFDVFPSVSAGAAVYGALNGDRGGFFTVGFDAGVKLRLAGRLFVEGGLYAGGGGGSSAPQGGGLMLRTHAGVLYDLESVRLGAQYAAVRFPNGNIGSRGAAVMMEFPFGALRVSRERRRTGLAEYALPSLPDMGVVREQCAVRYQFFMPAEGIPGKGGTLRIGRFALAGFEYGRALGRGAGLFIETAGAAGGDADGYAELLAGVSYAVPLLRSGEAWERGSGLKLHGRVSAGAGGGGGMDTGGGALLKAGIGLAYEYSGGLVLAAVYGTLDALDGPFRGEFAAVHAGWAYDLVVKNGWGARRPGPGERASPLDWRVRAAHQTYTTMDGTMRVSGQDREVSLFGIKADRLLSEHLYLTGQVLSAYDGEAGGYTAGFMGAGIGSRIADSGAGIFMEALIGAAGGGGIDVGGGTVVQPSTGLWFDLGDVVQIEASVGRIMASTGRLNSTIMDLSMTYRFSSLSLL